MPSSKPLTSVATAKRDIDGEVRKANEAIAIRPMTGESLTFLTRKLYNTMLFHAQQQGVSKARYSMPLRTITHGADFNSNDIGLVKEHLKKMRRTEVEWNDPGKEWGVASLVSEAVIRKVNDELVLEWEYTSTIQQKLLSPSRYTPIALAHQAVMRTHGGLALLEICLRYETFVGQLTERKPWEWWYPVLTGNTESKARTSKLYFYRYFKRDTIKTAIAEVNGLTDFVVELIEHTKGRKVLDIQFKVCKKVQPDLAGMEHSAIVDMSLMSRMLVIGLKEPDAQKIYANHEENLIRAALDATEKKMRSKVRPDSAVAYFRSALNSDWIQPADQVVVKPKISAPKDLPKPAPSAVTTAALEAFNSLADDEKGRLLEEFVTENPSLASRVRTNPDAAVVRNMLGPWLVKRG